MRAHRRLRGDRAASASRLSRFASSQSGITLRGVLLDWRGLILFLLVLPIVIWGGMAVTP